MRCRLAAMAAMVGVCMIALAGSARAQNLLERLIMPGPLVQNHAKLEGECAKCHEPFSRQSQTRLCLDCHKDIAGNRRARTGFHGRQPEAEKQDCKHCHTDHKGRDADITQLDRETFNHDFSNFQLVDAHKSVRCDGCHVTKARFRNTPSVCFECHKRIDPHRGRLGEQCDGCHTVVSWRRTKPFDHAKTRFALEGAHKDVGCATCHAGELYKDLSRTCASCHRLQDVHAERYGAKCETCHDQGKWKPAHFDHDKTRYSLRGAHAAAKCDACHPGDLYRDKLATTCISCHRKNDPHKGQLGARCERCHNDSDWRKNISFDHDIARFPLIGLHAQVPCEECHHSLAYKPEPIVCEKCHKDWHQGRLGARCATCHTPNGWARWRFDHARQTKYPLTGAHEKLLCETCHTAKSPPNLHLATDCYSCHRGADAHTGTFGRSCERCHTTADWRRLALRN